MGSPSLQHTVRIKAAEAHKANMTSFVSFVCHELHNPFQGVTSSAVGEARPSNWLLTYHETGVSSRYAAKAGRIDTPTLGSQQQCYRSRACTRRDRDPCHDLGTQR